MKKKTKANEKPERITPIKAPSREEIKRLLTIGARCWTSTRKATAKMLIIPDRIWRMRLR